ncbi:MULTISPECIES: hypothetical protein [Citrobacter freundii complex]|jgi:DNA segregation ATPase FtsK/SpoIIIE-like protein|nr:MULTISPECIES: hypothetical protein [Citrobacter freundii complex]WOU50989.1 hypothetical protein R4T22_07050 [Citrobacter portucalensis]
MNKLQTIADMLRLANRLNEIVAEMEARKKSMLAEMTRKAA